MYSDLPLITVESEVALFDCFLLVLLVNVSPRKFSPQEFGRTHRFSFLTNQAAYRCHAWFIKIHKFYRVFVPKHPIDWVNSKIWVFTKTLLVEGSSLFFCICTLYFLPVLYPRVLLYPPSSWNSGLYRCATCVSRNDHVYQ